MSKDDDIQFIPEEIYDRNTRTTYKKGRYFGKVWTCFFIINFYNYFFHFYCINFVLLKLTLLNI